jgi:phosphoglycerate dehydrogenase-like enzyme
MPPEHDQPMTHPNRPKIVLLDPLSGSGRERFAALVDPAFELLMAKSYDPDEQLRLIECADYAITGQIPVPAQLLKAAHRLRLLHKWGVGVDNIDLEAARSAGITVARLPGSNAIPVAEFTIGLMIALLRNLAWGHAQLKQGHWGSRNLPHDSLMLYGRTVGLVGFGAIGQRVAVLLKAFGCRVLATRRSGAPALENDVEIVALERLLSESDVVSLHCPLTAETAGLIDHNALRRMKPHAVLINVARGGVVNERDLHWALKTRVILGAATDVYDIEPLPPESPLLELDNLVVSPHLAGIAADNFQPTISRMLANVTRIERGEPLPEHEQVVP